MPEYKVECVYTPAHVEIGECPTWSVEEQCLYWIDIEGKAFHRFDPATRTNQTWAMPTMPGSFVLAEEGGVVLAMQDGFHHFAPEADRLTKLLDAPFDQARIRFNDGRTDRQGRYWVGSQPLAIIPTGGSEGQGTLYCLDGQTLTIGIASIDIANGLTFSPDGTRLYRSECLHRKLYVSDMDPKTGKLGRERVFTDTPGQGVPDGATMDAEGGYWAALPLGGQVVRFTPDGRFDFAIETPVIAPTMPAFGGPDMSTLYITSGRLEHLLGQQSTPLSGSIFAVEVPFKGIPETKFKMQK